MRSFFIFSVLFITLAGFNVENGKSKFGKIAFFDTIDTGKIILHSKPVLMKRLTVDICSALTIGSAKSDEGYNVSSVFFETIDIKKIGEKYYLVGVGKTNDDLIPFFLCCINLTREKNDLVIQSKENPSAFCGANMQVNFIAEESEEDCKNGDFKFTGTVAQPELYKIWRCGFESKGMAAYFND